METNLKKSAPYTYYEIAQEMMGKLRWTRTSYYMLSSFLLLLFLIGYVWWPLLDEYLSYFNRDYPIWKQIDWLLVGNFAFMSSMIMTNANIRADLPIVVIGMFGGLAIEGWGTQTELWTYYTSERPPLWIIPAWPIASLSIDRLYRLIKLWASRLPDKLFDVIHWTAMPAFFGLMVYFVSPTADKSLTIASLILCAFLILSPDDPRATVLTFTAGSGLGYFLELWGTTRECWTYYTQHTPPLFAVLAHGMAAVAFWRALKLYHLFKPRIATLFKKTPR